MPRFLIALSLVSVWFSLSGCTGSYCSDPDHQSEAMCQLNLGGTVAAFTVSPPRITLNKDSTTQITITAFSKLANQAATLTQVGGPTKPMSLGLVGMDGQLRTTIRASDLAAQGFVPGAADVEIAGQKRRIRIYVAPRFDSGTFSAVRSVTADQGAGNLATPSWVGIQANSAKKILTLNEYSIATIAKQAIGEYFYDVANKAVSKFSPPLFSAYNSVPQMDMLQHTIALNMSGLIVPEFGNASISLLTQCALDGVCATDAVPYSNISSLSSYWSSSLYVGIFSGKVQAFSDAKLATPLPIAGSPASGATPAALTVYDANGDAQPDVIVWHADGNISVALSDSAGKRLTYDAATGDALKGLALLSPLPDAVAAGDIDRDGLDDLVIAKGASLYVLSNEGTGTFSAGAALPIPTQGAVGSVQLPPVSAIAIGDISASDAGFADLVLVSKSSRLIGILENTATVN